MAEIYKVVTTLYDYVYKNIGTDGNPKSKNNTILMGSFVKVLPEENGNWQKFFACSKEGWIVET